jgi:hypothetical protein
LPKQAESETALYPAVKRFLEEAGYSCKGEIGGCDLLATREGNPPVIVELKRALNLEVILQAVDRLAVTDRVFIAVPSSRHALARLHDRRVRKLLRRIGLGLMAVGRTGRVEIALEPAAYRPRPNRRRYEALMREHQRRVGDPSIGGSTRRPIMTAYRQDALRCAAALQQRARATPSQIRTSTGVQPAGRILLRNVYGWFVRLERGCYGLSDAGRAALSLWAGEIDALTGAPSGGAAAAEQEPARSPSLPCAGKSLGRG